MQKTFQAAVVLLGLVLLAGCGEDKEAVGGGASGGDTYTPDPSLKGALAQCENFVIQQTINDSESNWKQRLKKPPQFKFDTKDQYFWNLTTSHGDIKIKLWPEVAPMHVSSTIYLTQVGFYDGIIFHRVIPGFMAQGGCPIGRGSGGPGYKYSGEFDPKVKHDRGGLLSMANAGPGTDGSQFFLTFVPTPHLNMQHTLFGEIVEGTQTLRAIEKLGVKGRQGGKPRSRITIKKATITVE
ncbi:MAG: peptidylprolyl isomerase [Planctomycetota bacterium]